MTILLVEDDKNLVASLTEYLGIEGYTVCVSSSLREARNRVGDLPSMVLLDWMLPDGQGIELVREWRQQGIQTPIIFLTARVELIDKVLGLELGANDYVTKPFEPRELLARIRAQLRQPRPARESNNAVIEMASIRIDVAAHLVELRGKRVELKKMEFKLLRMFLENAGQAFSREELLTKVWGYEDYPTTRTIDTHILQLRQKLGAALFETVRGIGYRFQPKNDTSSANVLRADDNGRAKNLQDEGVS